MKEKEIKFQSYDGYKLEGTFTVADPERGAVLFVHGIMSSRDELGFHADYAAYLAANGISSLRFDLRYHGVYEADLKDLTLSGIVNDIDAAFSCLKENVRTSSFFIIASSFGGGLSVYWADFYKRKGIKRVILNAPVINYQNDVLERNDLLQNGRLTENAQTQLAEQGFVISSGIHFGRGLINELNFIDCIGPMTRLAEKIVIFHGDQDDDVPLESSKKYMAEQSELKIVKGVGHVFGVKGDGDPNSPETKAVHQGIYKEALNFIAKALT